MPSLTPAGWLTRLERMLAHQQAEVSVFENYYAGRHRLAFATEKYRQAFGVLFQALADNYCAVVVDASAERLAIEGFRSGQDQGSSNDAWSIWQANNLDADSVMAHTEAVKNGRAYVMVAPPLKNGEAPRITVEHPSQTIVAHVPGDRRRRAAALKKWVDEDGFAYANLFLPGQFVKYRSQQKLSGISQQISWQAYDGGRLSFDVVPVIPLYNNPSMLTGGVSDLSTAIPLQDAINKEVADMLVASEFAAFIQRVFIGVQVPTIDDGDGNQIPDPNFEVKASVGRVFHLENPQAKIAEFAASDLKNYIAAITMLRNDLAAQTRTPPHYLLGEIVNASGDALKAAEVGLVAKVRRKQIDFGEGWEEAMGLALTLQGKPVDQAAEVKWRDPEFRSEGEQVDAAVKLRTLGLPLEAIWERVGATPQQIEEWKRQAGLPDRPPPGATTAAVPGAPTSQVPPVMGGQ